MSEGQGSVWGIVGNWSDKIFILWMIPRRPNMSRMVPCRLVCRTFRRNLPRIWFKQEQDFEVFTYSVSICSLVQSDNGMEDSPLETLKCAQSAVFEYSSLVFHSYFLPGLFQGRVFVKILSEQKDLWDKVYDFCQGWSVTPFCLRTPFIQSKNRIQIRR